jgi:hypothetical protein
MGGQGGARNLRKRMLWFLPAEAWEAALADGFGDIELFRAVVEAGGISAGAEALGSSPMRSAGASRRWRRALACGWLIAARGVSV